MWIEKKENSKGTRYVYKERFHNPNTGKDIKISVTLNSNSNKAQKEAVRLLQEKFNSKIETATTKKDARINSLTFYEVADKWEEYTRPTVKAETSLNHRQYIRRIKQAVPSSLLLLDFTPNTAERIVHEMYYNEKLSFSYCSATLNIIKSIMKYAKKQEYIKAMQRTTDYEYSITDFTEIKLKKRPSTKEELQAKANKFLDADELKDCLQQIDGMNHRIALAMEFISLTGLRVGELLALRLQDYSKEKKIVNVNGTIVKSAANGSDVQRGTPKNEYSYRDVTLNQRAIDILEWFILENKRRKWKDSAYRDKDGYIFTTRTGNPYNVQYINKYLRKVRIPNKHISSHIFRHTHISMLAEKGVELKAIMNRVGHNDPNTTLSIYTHVTEAMQEKMQAVLESLSV